MCTGKTKELIRILLERKSGVIVSSRKTFTNSLVNRLLVAGVNVVNY
jgi:hypothetical protein